MFKFMGAKWDVPGCAWDGKQCIVPIQAPMQKKAVPTIYLGSKLGNSIAAQVLAGKKAADPLSGSKLGCLSLQAGASALQAGLLVSPSWRLSAPSWAVSKLAPQLSKLGELVSKLEPPRPARSRVQRARADVCARVARRCGGCPAK
eukprot:CAMPEP_0206227034 /NCGR_PEP_ID=MMETSP0047_2-20121206/8408_1 /ASSEMBLY_ACC=CAM_ASM_000192 /TAXON_ID=195065 /ORGANISM="Chroomonas mesostigmatica_cf, Strain CCMP1168" /LENGTH=145 /DNA_ID=CAMNT_0053650159 /DNA_START=44 /DNA_END=480 /DNA_ORIENTATION=-